MTDNLIERAKLSTSMMSDALVSIEVTYGLCAAEDAYRSAPDLVRELVAALGAEREVEERPVEDSSWRQTDTGVTAGGKPVDWCPKWLRECLCAQQTNAPDDHTRGEIGRLIRLLDLHRPLANDGKHRTLHTPTCGCDDR